MTPVALWGCYEQGNFGDDLMAVIFAKALMNAGYAPRIFGLDRLETEQNQLPPSVGIREMLDGAKALILGGGAVLKNTQYLRALFGASARKIEYSYITLRKEIRRSKIPLIPISIGSDGGTIDDVSWFRRRLLELENCQKATVRLPSDLKILSALNVDAEYFPDVLFGAAELLQIEPRRRVSQPARILVNLHRNYATAGEALIARLQREYPSAELVVANSHLPGRGTAYEWMPGIPRVEPYRYRGTRDFIELLRTIDLTISSKLHIGICTLAFGGAFVNVGGRGKVLAQLTDLNMADAYLPPEECEQSMVGGILSNYGRLQRRYGEQISARASQATRHVQIMLEEISKYA